MLPGILTCRVNASNKFLFFFQPFQKPDIIRVLLKVIRVLSDWFGKLGFRLEKGYQFVPFFFFNPIRLQKSLSKNRVY